MRPFTTDRETIEPGRMGRLRILRVAFPLLLGTAPASRLDTLRLPITFALANPKADQRDVAIDMFDHDPTLFNGRSVQTIVADKG